MRCFKFLLIWLLAMFIGGCMFSVREMERGPDIDPVNVPRNDRVTKVNPGYRPVPQNPCTPTSGVLPRMMTTPVAPNDTAAMPVFEPHRAMVWHVQPYTKSNSVFIGPHNVVIKIEPGRFLKGERRSLDIPVAAPLVEVEEPKRREKAEEPTSYAPTSLIPGGIQETIKGARRVPELLEQKREELRPKKSQKVEIPPAVRAQIEKFKREGLGDPAP